MYRYSAFCSTIQGTSCATSVPRTFVSGTSGYILPNLVVYALCELNVCWKRCVARGNGVVVGHNMFIFHTDKKINDRPSRTIRTTGRYHKCIDYKHDRLIHY